MRLNTIISGRIHFRLILKRYPFMRHLMNSTSVGAANSLRKSHRVLRSNRASHHHQRSAILPSIITAALPREILSALHQSPELVTPHLDISSRTLSLLNIEVGRQ